MRLTERQEDILINVHKTSGHVQPGTRLEDLRVLLDAELITDRGRLTGKGWRLRAQIVDRRLP